MLPRRLSLSRSPAVAKTTTTELSLSSSSPPPSQNDGYLIVLTASEIEMSDFYINPFIAFTGGFPSGLIPLSLLRKKWYPPAPDNPDLSVKFAPYGLRKVEALLIDEFGADNVITVRPTHLERVIGNNTRVIGISSMDPLGLGFVSRTYTSILGLKGEPIVATEFRLMVTNPVFRKYRNNNLRVILGGAGAWQFTRFDPKLQKQYGIDTVVIGEAEGEVVELFRKAIRGEPLPARVDCKKPDVNRIPKIKHASLFGTVEVTRGCGRGCQFCSPTMRNQLSFKLEHILAEAKLNAQAGTRMIVLQTDDIFLYRTLPKFKPNREAVVKLIESVAKLENVEYVQIAHATLSPIVVEPKMVEEFAPTLVAKSRWVLYNGKRYANFEIGLETGSTRLMRKYMRGKALPFEPEQWQDIVVEALGILNDNDIYPLGTLITGLPDEREADTLATLEMLDRLKDAKLFYVPLLFTSEEESLLKTAPHANLVDCNILQWEVFIRCWQHNVRIFGNKAHRLGIPILSLPLCPFLISKHGKKILYPYLRFTGLAETFVGRKLINWCKPEYCGLLTTGEGGRTATTAVTTTTRSPPRS